MMRILCAFAAIMLLSGAASAAPLEIDLASDHVDITTGFDGAEVVVYGLKEKPDGEVAVVLSGPDRTMVVRRKAEVMGAYVNRQSVEFRRVPSYYDYALSAPSSDIADEPVLDTNVIGLRALNFYPENDLDMGELLRFREALIRNKQVQGLYPLGAKPIRPINDLLFKVEFILPANMPTGRYSVNAYLFEKGVLTGQDSKILRVGQVGFSARINLFAQNHALSYGVLAVVIAFLSGLGAYAFLRRD